MKSLIILSFCIFAVYLSFAQKKVDTTLNSIKSRIEQIQVKTTITGSELSHLQESLTHKNELWIEKNGPWLAALLIGILTVVTNILTSYYMRQISRDTIKSQIESSEQTSSLNIKNSQNLAFTQFKSTLKTKNRQDWVNEVRLSVTELTTQCKMLNIEFQDPSLNIEKIKFLLEKVTFHRNKLLLLLNPGKDTHKPVLSSIDSLMTILDKHFFFSKDKTGTFDNGDFMQKTNAVIECGRTLCYEEWQKIQELLK